MRKFWAYAKSDESIERLAEFASNRGLESEAGIVILPAPDIDAAEGWDEYEALRTALKQHMLGFEWWLQGCAFNEWVLPCGCERTRSFIPCAPSRGMKGRATCPHCGLSYAYYDKGEWRQYQTCPRCEGMK